MLVFVNMHRELGVKLVFSMNKSQSCQLYRNCLQIRLASGSSYHTDLLSCFFCCDWNSDKWGSLISFSWMMQDKLPVRVAFQQCHYEQWLHVIIFFHLMKSITLPATINLLLYFFYKYRFKWWYSAVLPVCLSLKYLVCMKLFIVTLIFALHVFIRTPSALPPLPPEGNSDSGKWDSWFEGETSACGRSAGLRRGSEWHKRMHTGEEEWIEFLMFIDGWVRWRWVC